MLRSSFGLALLWAGLGVAMAPNTGFAQWFGGNCGCGPRPTLFGPPPIMRQSSCNSCGMAGPAPVFQSAYGGGGEYVSCGQPISCTIDQPVVQMRQMATVAQAVKVQQLQPVVHPVMAQVQVVEHEPVIQKVSKPIYETKWVDQAVTEMRPVVSQQVQNVPTVDYQTVTEYKQVKKQVGYWVTKNEPTGKISACQYDNRPGLAGWFNRASYDMRTAFTPQQRTSREFVPRTMTCTVPCTKRVAVPGMKQVTYNVTQMVPQQTTKKVAVQTVRYVDQEITVMKPKTVVKTMQVGTRISYAPVGSTGEGSGVGTALTPTPDNKASARGRTPSRTAENFNTEDFGKPSGGANYTPRDTDRTEALPQLTKRSSLAVEPQSVEPRSNDKTPSVIRVSQWVARTTPPSTNGKSSMMSVAKIDH